MVETAYSLYEGIVAATSSELILFFVLVAILLPIFLTYVLRQKKLSKQYESDKRQHELELKQHDMQRLSREWEQQQQIINVVKENSTIIAGLKHMLHNNNQALTGTLERLEKSLTRVHVRLDERGIPQ